jgi:hypothetical protein
MKRIERFKFLQIFGDGKPHNWFEIVFLGVNFLKVHQFTFEKIFKQALDCNLIRRVETPEVKSWLARMADHKKGIFVGPSWQDYEYIITETGDQCLREEQIQRAGDHDYYSSFDRTIEGKNGLDRFAPLPKWAKPL